MPFDTGGGYLVDPDAAETVARQILSELDALDGVLANQEQHDPVPYNEGNRNTEQQMAQVQVQVGDIQRTAAIGMRTSAENLLKAIDNYRRNQADGADVVRRTLER
jgi:hypothetical protein